MIRSDIQRLDAKRRQINERKKQFADAAYKQQDYPHRLNFYEIPPTSEISLEDFEKWAIDRLRSECSAICPSVFGLTWTLSSRRN
jgi:DNA primase large subunit